MNTEHPTLKIGDRVTCALSKNTKGHIYIITGLKHALTFGSHFGVKIKRVDTGKEYPGYIDSEWAVPANQPKVMASKLVWEVIGKNLTTPECVEALADFIDEIAMADKLPQFLDAWIKKHDSMFSNSSGSSAE